MMITDQAPKPHELPLEQRNNRIQRIFIRYDAIIKAQTVLDRTLVYGRRVREAETGYIIGASRCGKTETVKRFIKKTTGKTPDETAFVQLIDGNGVKIVYADMTNGATPLVASQMILTKIFGDVKSNGLKEPEAAGRLIEWFQNKQINMFVIDEAQQLFNGHGTGAADKLGKWLLSLENACSFSIALLGSPELDSLLHFMAASNERKGGVARLMPFDFKTSAQKTTFRRFVERFAKDLPFLSSCLVDKEGHCSDWMLYAVYYATRGRPGALAKLLEHATVEAFEDKKNDGIPHSLELEHYARAFDYGLLEDHRMREVNPFRVADTTRLPSISPSYFDEQQEVAAWKREVKKAARRGGRLYDAL